MLFRSLRTRSSSREVGISGRTLVAVNCGKKISFLIFSLTIHWTITYRDLSDYTSHHHYYYRHHPYHCHYYYNHHRHHHFGPSPHHRRCPQPWLPLPHRDSSSVWTKPEVKKAPSPYYLASSSQGDCPFLTPAHPHSQRYSPA